MPPARHTVLNSCSPLRANPQVGSTIPSDRRPPNGKRCADPVHRHHHLLRTGRRGGCPNVLQRTGVLAGDDLLACVRRERRWAVRRRGFDNCGECELSGFSVECARRHRSARRGIRRLGLASHRRERERLGDCRAQSRPFPARFLRNRRCRKMDLVNGHGQSRKLFHVEYLSDAGCHGHQFRRKRGRWQRPVLWEQPVVRVSMDGGWFSNARKFGRGELRVGDRDQRQRAARRGLQRQCQRRASGAVGRYIRHGRHLAKQPRCPFRRNLFNSDRNQYRWAQHCRLRQHRRRDRALAVD